MEPKKASQLRVGKLYSDLPKDSSIEPTIFRLKSKNKKHNRVIFEYISGPKSYFEVDGKIEFFYNNVKFYIYTMNATEIKLILNSLNACDTAMEWSKGKDLKTIWEECPRGDWMLWLIYYAKVDKRLHTLAKGKCAETVIHLMKDERSVAAVKAAIDFGNGLIDEIQLAAYADAADAAAAAAATAAAAAAAAAAYDYAYAAAAAYDYDYAAYAADAAAKAAAAYVVAANAAAAAKAVDADVAARKENQLQTANICREIVPYELILKHLNKI